MNRAGADISFLYQEFTEALTEVLAENAADPAVGRIRQDDFRAPDRE